MPVGRHGGRPTVEEAVFTRLQVPLGDHLVDTRLELLETKLPDRPVLDTALRAEDVELTNDELPMPFFSLTSVLTRTNSLALLAALKYGIPEPPSPEPATSK